MPIVTKVQSCVACYRARPHQLEDEMSRSHTIVNLADVEDAAPSNGFGDRWEARVARDALDAEQVGVTYFRLRAGKRSPFAHRHIQAEEVYVVLSGSGRVKLDDQLIDVQPFDTIRIAPEVARAFEAGPEGLDFLAFGRHHQNDGEPVDDPWVNRPAPSDQSLGKPEE